MLELADYVHLVFRERYAMTAYKTTRLGWSLDREIGVLKAEIQAHPDLSNADFQRAFYTLLRSTNDNHVNAVFDDTRAVWLGLHLRRTRSGFFIAWIDRRALPTGRFPFSTGDEVVTFDGAPIATAAERSGGTVRLRSTPAFDAAAEDLLLTLRSTPEWPALPAVGSVAQIGIRKKGQGEPEVVELPWLDLDVNPPSERCPLSFMPGKKSYVPDLGTLVWENEASSLMPARVFGVGDRAYGYLRLRTYDLPHDDQAQLHVELRAAIEQFEKQKVAAVVIDQLGNPGGNYFFGLSLLSPFFDRPIAAPLQRTVVAVDGHTVGWGSVSAAAKLAAALGKVRTAEQADAAARANAMFNGRETFMPPTVSTMRQVGGFFALLAKQVGHAGLTAPHVTLLDEVAPNAASPAMAKVPLLVLIDELNVSAPEFVAAALKDSGRARLFGITTSGSGGDQRRLSRDKVCARAASEGDLPYSECVPASVAAAMKALGIMSFGYTIAMGVRRTGISTPQYVENVGVTPDVDYAVTAEDLRSGFEPYRVALLAALK
jgi:hypothetical protein